jgi:hypothetical protein
MNLPGKNIEHYNNRKRYLLPTVQFCNDVFDPVSLPVIGDYKAFMKKSELCLQKTGRNSRNSRLLPHFSPEKKYPEFNCTYQFKETCRPGSMPSGSENPVFNGFSIPEAFTRRQNCFRYIRFFFLNISK